MSNTYRLEGVLAVLILSAISARSQSADPRLSAADWAQRAEAAHDLSVVSHRAVTGDEALIALLAKEDAVVRAAFIEGPGVAEKYGEEYGEYVGILSDVVTRIAEEHPEYPGVWQALVNAPYDPSSQFVKWLAQRAEKVTPLLLSQATGADPSPSKTFQGQAIETLARIAGFDKTAPVPKLSPAQTAAIDALVRSSLVSQTEAIRIGAIRGLSGMGNESDVAILERLTTDPTMGRIAASALEELKKRLNRRAVR
jgi:hypothetical protein